jgi:hypothetical protein
MVIVDPSALADAAASLGSLGTSLEEANVVAELPTTGILPPAADEVSAAITSLFNTHGALHQQLSAQVSQFHAQFTTLLGDAEQAYRGTEEAIQNALRATVTQVEQPFIPLLSEALDSVGFNLVGTTTGAVMPTGPSVALLVGGTSYPLLSWPYPWLINNLYYSSLPSSAIGSIYTPEQFWPLTPTLGSLTLDQSINQGTALLNTAIMNQLRVSNHVSVWTTSQSSTVATDEIRNLMAEGSPYSNRLSFILTGNPNNPNGGIFERFNGLYIPGLDVAFNGTTPPNAPYQIAIYTNQYDGVGDFPQYPLNVVSDVNAIMGFLVSGQHDYAPWFPLSYTQLPTSPGYTDNTTYYMSLTQNLPLVTPLREYLPAPYGNALADLLQPDLRVIVDMGYGTGEYANIPTPASLVEIPDPFNIVADLAYGTIQGPEAALVDLGLLPYSYYPMGQYPFSPVLSPDLNYPLPQTPVTGLSLLTGLEGSLTNALFG